MYNRRVFPGDTGNSRIAYCYSIDAGANTSIFHSREEFLTEVDGVKLTSASYMFIDSKNHLWMAFSTHELPGDASRAHLPLTHCMTTDALLEVIMRWLEAGLQPASSQRALHTQTSL